MSAETHPDKHWILAIDPGVTSGLCHGKLDTKAGKLSLRVDQQRLTVGGVYDLILSEIPDKFEGNFHLIYEDFQYRNVARAGLELFPVKVIGVIELSYERFVVDGLDHVHFYKQSAATGKGFYRDDKLKKLGVYAVGKDHGRDATRHLLQWLSFGAGSQYADIEKLEVTQDG